MAKGNNKYGAAGRGGVPAETVVAFLDHYTYEGYNPTGRETAATVDLGRTKRINGRKITVSMQRTIRRYRNGQVTHVSPKGLLHVLVEYGFDLPWFHGWCKLHRKPIK